MDKNIKPTTTWQNQTIHRNEDSNGMEALWDKCFNDDDCRQEDKDNVSGGNDIVSIRCRRHRKRINVEKDWAKTCSWLCPKCFMKLSAAQRQKYAPKETTEKPNKPIPRKILVVKKPQKSTNRITDSLNKPSLANALPLVASPNITSLLPEWRLVCKKCKHTRPVHRIWIDNTSKVLCPDCYSSMTESDVQRFHKKYPDETAVVTRVAAAPILHCDKVDTPKENYLDKIEYKGGYEPETIVYGGRCSSHFITHATDKELLAAVKAGRVSKVRARIEFNRRKNKEYFNDIPDVTTYQYCKI